MSELQEWYDQAASKIITINILRRHFRDDDKVLAWLKTKNPNLGNVSPLELIKRGRAHKVLEFIESAMKENKI